MTIEEMKNIDPCTVDINTLVQRSSVKVSSKKSSVERICEFVEQIKNPYCYLDGKTIVKISFSDTERSIMDCIQEYLNGV